MHQLKHMKYHSFQEFSITNNREQEIRVPAKSWKRPKRPINSIVTYKDWLYVASVNVEGSKLKVRTKNYNHISYTMEDPFTEW